MSQPARKLYHVNPRIKVTLIDAKNLKASDIGGSSDPYIQVTVGATTFRTRVKKKTLFPMWDETFEFKVTNQREDKIIMKVMDWDKMSKDDHLGTAIVDIASLKPGQEVIQRLKLAEVETGEIRVRLTPIDFNDLN